MTGSGCSSPSSCRTPSRRSGAGARSISPAGGRVESFHITLAFLGHSTASELEPSSHLLRKEAAATEPFLLEPVRYRETRSVGMVVLADPSGRATDLAGRCSAASNGSACTSRSGGRGCRTSRSCGSASDRGSSRRCRSSARSLRPGPLLSFHVCTRQGRGTRSWNRVR